MRPLFAILGGMALGLAVALSLGATIGTMHSFACFHRAVRPGEKAALLGESIANGMNCAAAAALLLVPAGAIVAWRKTRASPNLG